MPAFLQLAQHASIGSEDAMLRQLVTWSGRVGHCRLVVRGRSLSACLKMNLVAAMGHRHHRESTKAGVQGAPAGLIEELSSMQAPLPSMLMVI